MVPYSTTGSAFYQVWNGAAWLGAGLAVTTIGDSYVVQARRTTNDLILTAWFDDGLTQYDFSYWNGSVWSPLETLETTPSDTAAPFRETFMIAPKLPATRGTIVSTPIDFDDGVSPAWDKVLWSATTTGATTIAIQVEYLDSGGEWSLIPDIDLPGNSVGDTSTATPIVLNTLNTSVYNELRLKATLDRKIVV